MLQKFLLKIYPGLLSSVVFLAILWLTLAPHPLPEDDLPMFPHLDKVVHALMFGGFVFSLILDRELILQRSYAATGRMPRRHSGAVILFCVAAILFGGGIELLQNAMGLGRGADWFDFAADAVGVIIFALVSPRIATLLLCPR